ncbi:hypothetical protein ACJX0J_021346, partial [Zea mays]
RDTPTSYNFTMLLFVNLPSTIFCLYYRKVRNTKMKVEEEVVEGLGLVGRPIFPQIFFNAQDACFLFRVILNLNQTILDLNQIYKKKPQTYRSELLVCITCKPELFCCLIILFLKTDEIM